MISLRLPRQFNECQRSSLADQLNEAQSVLNAASDPYAGLLWLEFLCSPVDQAIVDQYEPYGASYLTAGSVQEKIVRGLKLSVVDWELLPSSTNTKRKSPRHMVFPEPMQNKIFGQLNEEGFSPAR